jgi:ketosteroid isomerase-like protein
MAQAPAGQDEPALRQLNDDYVRAFLACDVARFQILLADDFAGVLADGRVIDKAEFLREAASKPDAADLRLHDVTIRAYGDSAMVMAAVTYRRHDGLAVRTRYSTLYVRRDGKWTIAWVQWTRVIAA